MVDFIYEKLRSKKDHKQIVKDLLEDIISPDYAQTSKIIFSHQNYLKPCYELSITYCNHVILTIDGVGCDNMTCVLITFKK